MTLLELRAGIVAAVTRLVGGDRVRVLPHGGRFGSDEIKRYGTSSPAVLVAILGISDLNACGSLIDATVTCAALIVTSDQPNLPRDAGALVIAGNLAAQVPGNRWDLDVGGATGVRGDNLYSGVIDALGIAMWAIAWKQPSVTLSPLDTASLDDFLSLAVTLPNGAALDIPLPQ